MIKYLLYTYFLLCSLSDMKNIWVKALGAILVRSKTCRGFFSENNTFSILLQVTEILPNLFFSQNNSDSIIRLKPPKIFKSKNSRQDMFTLKFVYNAV